MVYGAKAFSETGLLDKLKVIKPAFETVRDDSREQLIDMAQQCYELVVLQ